MSAGLFAWDSGERKWPEYGAWTAHHFLQRGVRERGRGELVERLVSERHLREAERELHQRVLRRTGAAWKT